MDYPLVRYVGNWVVGLWYCWLFFWCLYVFFFRFGGCLFGVPEILFFLCFVGCYLVLVYFSIIEFSLTFPLLTLSSLFLPNPKNLGNFPRPTLPSYYEFNEPTKKQT